MIKKDYIIVPIFLNNLGCPQINKCTFCNQAVSGGTYVTLDTFKDYLEQYFNSLSKSSNFNNLKFEIAFYGGTFTNLDLQLQQTFFKISYEILNKFNISKNSFLGFRISTRPDAISNNILYFLKENGVNTIEVGVESFNDKVLIETNRGYNYQTIIKSINLIKQYNFNIVIHIMCGLPYQTRDVFKNDIDNVIKLKPHFVRVHPLYVLSGSSLALKYINKEFIPKSNEELIEEVAYAIAMFELNNIKIIRIGIQDNEKLNSQVLAGPFYPNLREVAESLIHLQIFEYLKSKFNILNQKFKIITYSKQIQNYLIGYKKMNIKKNIDLLLEFENKIIYNTQHKKYIEILDTNDKLILSISREELLKMYILKFNLSCK